MATHLITSGDTLRIFSDTLYFQGASLDLTGATVKLALVEVETNEIYYVNAQVTDAETGAVQYQTTDAFYAAIGADKTYRCEWHVAMADGTDITVPTQAEATIGEIRIHVLPQIDKDDSSAVHIIG